MEFKEVGLDVGERRVGRLMKINGLVVEGGITQASGIAEREAALAMQDRRPGRRRITLGGDKAFDYPDMAKPAYILFEEKGGGDFAFGCCTGHIWEASSTKVTSIGFSWDGSDEMTEICGDGSTELQSDGFLHGEICYVTATNIPSSHENELLQQPANAY